MPRFFFHTRQQDQIHLDVEGADLPNLMAAYAQAVLSARQMMANELRHGPLTLGRSFEITCANQKVLATVAFHDCLYYALYSASVEARTHTGHGATF